MSPRCFCQEIYFHTAHTPLYREEILKKKDYLLAIIFEKYFKFLFLESTRKSGVMYDFPERHFSGSIEPYTTKGLER